MSTSQNEIEYQYAVVLSTGHLSRWLAEEWEAPIKDPVANEIHDRQGWCIPYGYRTRLWDEDEYFKLPDELVQICDWVREHCRPDVTHIIFDSDGPNMEGLPVYEW